MCCTWRSHCPPQLDSTRHSTLELVTTQGFHPGFAMQWLKSCATTWPVAFVAVTLIAPWVRRVVARITA